MSDCSPFIMIAILLSLFSVRLFWLVRVPNAPEMSDEQIRKDLKEEGRTDEEIDAFLKEFNKITDNYVKTVRTDDENDIIERGREI